MTGASLVLLTVTVKSWVALAPCSIGCGDADVERPDIIVQRRTGEGLGCRIEAEPGWQRAAIGKCGRQGERVADIHIGKAGGGTVKLKPASSSVD